MLWLGKHGFTALINRSIFRVDLKGAIKILKGASKLAKFFISQPAQVIGASI